MIPTVIVSVIIVAIMSAIVVVGIRNKKKGKRTCSCGSCSLCGMSGVCHSNKEK